MNMACNIKRKNRNKQITNKLENDTENSTDIETHQVSTGFNRENENQFEGSKGIKRLHTNDGDDLESESEEKPKKAKKKKQAAGTEPTEKKGKKSIRQIKKEKHAQRQAEAQSIAKDQLKSQCITYLSQWKHDRQNWKFMKAKQVWLYKNKFSSQLVPEESWPILIEYFESAKGNIRTMLLADAHKIIKEMDEWTESQGKDNVEKEDSETTAEITKPDISVYNRARSLIQCLEE